MATALLILAAAAAVAAGGVLLFLQRPEFGRPPSGERQSLLEKSPHYRDGEFQNLEPTPMLVENRGFIRATLEYLLNKRERLRPAQPLPSVRADLKGLAPDREVLVWLGHSSFFLRLGGRNILIDPVFSPYASPVSFANRAFPGTTPYAADDFPEIDLLLITHDHWDHLDHPTAAALRAKTGLVITGLGVGAHLERWGFAAEKIRELDWNEELKLEGLTVKALPARHFSGRTLTRNRTLWLGFVLATERRRLLFSGDSGYGSHFKRIGEEFGSFDLVTLDSGQYDDGWPYVHMTPEEAARAAGELGAQALLPGHVGKFSIANHSWDDPFIRLAAASADRPFRLLTPLIGQIVYLDEAPESYPRWWEGLD